jgi:Uma2 family endonuclease
MAVAYSGLTLEQFLELPEEKPALEYFRGRVTRKMSPNAHHGRLQAFAVRVFEDLATPTGTAVAFVETRETYRDADASFVPDVSIFHVDRVPIDERGEVVLNLWVAPDIAVEILSPGQTIGSQIDRCRWYVENGVRAAVFVNPRTRTARVFRPGWESDLLRGADRIELTDVIPGVSLPVDELFAGLRIRSA